MKILRIYIDEAGSPHTEKPLDEEKFFVLSGVLINAKNYLKMRDSLNALKMKYFGNTKVVFHWYDIIHKRGIFERLKKSSIRRSFHNDLKEIYLQLPFCTVNAVINQSKLWDRYDNPYHPYHLGLRILMERAYFEAQDKRYSRVDLIAEGCHKTADTLLRIEHRRLLEMGSLHRTSGDFQSLGFGLTIIKKNKNVNGLQIADQTASIIRRTWFRGDKGETMPAQYNFVNKKFRTSRSGIYKGHGLIEFP
ncbi:DUF3800 domain-containing protein [bacterium]|nr:DUF3800 domain-containing protein [bacterium]